MRRLYRTAPHTLRRWVPDSHTQDLDVSRDFELVTALHAAGALSDTARDRFHADARQLLDLCNFGPPARVVRRPLAVAA